MATGSTQLRRSAAIDSFSRLASNLADLSAGQSSMLLVLTEFGRPATISDLIERTGLHANSIRETLTVLVDAGLVQRSAVPSVTRGRPAWQYEPAVPPSISALMDDFLAFAMAICRYLHANAADEWNDAWQIGTAWGDEIIAYGIAGVAPSQEDVPAEMQPSVSTAVPQKQRRVEGHSPTEPSSLESNELSGPTARLRILLSVLGFAARGGTDVGTIQLTVCPFSRAGRAPDPLICRMHAAMLSRLTAALAGEQYQARIAVNYPVAPCQVSLLKREGASV